MIRELTLSYLKSLKDCIDEIDLDCLQRVIESIYIAYQNKRQIFIMGNGGSASTASHFVCDLAKGTIVDNQTRMKVISLNDNTAMLSALANDCGYEEVFVEQLRNLLSPKDVVIVITGSGNSPNIIKAVNYAKQHNAITIGLIGFGGGDLAQIVDEQITISSENYGHCEDIHLALAHTISQAIRQLSLEKVSAKKEKRLTQYGLVN